MSVLRNTFTTLRKEYQRVFQREADKHLPEITDTLRNVAIFQVLSRGTLRALADAVHTRTYKKDEYLYFEQDPGLGLYIVQSGRIRLLIEDEDGSVQLLRQVDAYDLFGYLSIFGDFRRTETAQAVTETRVIGFFRPDLNTLIKRDPKAGAAILGVLANYLATQLVEMDNLLEARDGKLAAGRLLHGAAQRVEGSESGSPLTG
jgi:CRP/FNR family cyclic AMP-dependent transcriptional regulator